MNSRLKKTLAVFGLVGGLTFLLTQSVLAMGTDTVATPTGFKAFLTLVPIVLVLVLLFLNLDMILAGAIAAGVAMLIGGISLAEANTEMLGAIPQMLSITVPIINSSVAMVVFRAGSYTAALEWVNRMTKGKVEYTAGFIALLVALATYMSGIGGGSLMVIAPLAFAAVGVVPELIAGMSLAAAVSFISSPASLETGVISQLGGYDPSVHVNAMLPYWIGFTLLAILLAFWGTKRAKVGFKQSEDDRFSKMSNGELVRFMIPALFLLFAVIFGPIINRMTGIAIFTPLVYMFVTIFLTVIFTKTEINEGFKNLVDGSTYILTRLFQVGIFLGFINVIAKTGTFGVIANVAANVPSFIMVPVAVITGVLIGIPAGAYVGSILGLVLPVGIALGFSPLALGLTALGVGFGSQMSLVNISVNAISSGFQIPVIDIVKGNFKWIWSAIAILVVLSFFA